MVQEQEPGMQSGRAITVFSWALLALAVLFRAGSAHAQSAGAVQRSPSQAQETRDEGTSEVGQDGAARTDNLQIGPVIGIGFPRPLAIAGMVKVQRLVSIGAEYSFFPATTISGVHTSFWAVAADMRVFPFRDAFFVGLRAGRQHLSAETVVVYADQRFPVAAAVQTTFLNPRLGLLWTWSSGVTLGLDAGLQIPVSSRSSGVLTVAQTFALPQGMEIIDQVRGVADYLGYSTIPTLDLLRLGLLL